VRQEEHGVVQDLSDSNERTRTCLVHLVGFTLPHLCPIGSTMDTLSDKSIAALEDAVGTCDAARSDLEDALDAAEQAGGAHSDGERLEAVADALSRWQDAQEAFMDAVAESEVPDPGMAAMLLKRKADVDSANARMGLPGAHVDGADQPFELDMTGSRGQALTTAAMEYL